MANIHDRIQENYYDNKRAALKLPEMKDFTTIFVYKEGKVLVNGVKNSEIDLSVRYKKEDGYTIERKKDNEAYLAALREYTRAEEAIFPEEFKQDLFETLGIQNNPKRERLFAIARDRGDGFGYYAILNEAYELLDLIQ